MVTDTTDKVTQDKNLCYREISDDYGITHLPGLDAVLPTNPAPSYTVVELGCGTGHVSAFLKRSIPDSVVIATDLVPECLDIVHRNYPELDTQLVDADEPMPFEDSTVDLVLSSNLYEHLHDDGAHLRDIHRVLRDGGQYFISTPHFFADFVWTMIASGPEGRWLELTGRISGDHRISHCNLQSVTTLKRKLRKYGFKARALRRGEFSNNEREKVKRLLALLPNGGKNMLARHIETVWQILPKFLQPSIAVCGTKLSS